MRQTLHSTVDVALSSAARTASATSNVFKVEGAETLMMFLDITAKSGSPTLDVKLQTSPDQVQWFDASAFPQQTDVFADYNALTLRQYGKYVRVVGTFGGSGSITYSVKLERKER